MSVLGFAPASRAMLPAFDLGHGYKATGYQMINSVQISNFRSFDVAELPNCRRINIIVGENGSGKTALLEAIFLAAGPSPEIALRTRSWRGVEIERLTGTPELVERALWADLFHKFHTDKSAVVSLKGNTDHNRTVRVLFSDRTARILNRRMRRAGILLPEPTPIEFKWEAPGRSDVTISPRLEDGQIKIPPGSDTYVRSAFFAANRTYSGTETANRFSLLSRTFKEQEFIELFKKHFKNVQDLSLEVSAGNPMLFAKVDNLPERIPLSLASGGMNKLAAVLLAMPAQPGGVVLIDEIENGVYYRRIPAIWQSLLDLARRYDSQVFVSTHSAECLQSAADLAEQNPGDFSVIHSGVKDGSSRLRQYGGEVFAEAMADNIEIR